LAAEGGMSALTQPTPLAQVLAQRIARDGPISVHEYMNACLHDPEHGYYRTRAAIGAKEDFITAPEISQVFGELIGLWAAVVWQQIGSPSRVRLIELGPGRGTLMRDALRSARALPAFRDAIEVVLVEPNAALQRMQHAKLADIDAPLRWCADLATLADDTAAAAPTIVLANEILDVIPVTQLKRTDTGWIERGVGVNDAGHLMFVILGSAAPPHIAAETRPGDIVEVRDTRAFTAPLRGIADAGPLTALFIDYGYEGAAVGDTLQAVRAQSYEDPLASPGAADLTAHVDFAAFAAEVSALGLSVDGPRTQAAFLGSLGILERTSRLMAANTAAAASLEAATARLIAPTGMGAHFKVMGLRSPGLPPLPGL
jgi:NADH dehydrogenase [ubiquinone] 1 alpha subcomplex assembly factor 7